MSLLTATNLSKSFGDKLLFENISFSIADEKIGLIGINGTGKSTLLKLIAGLETSETGTVQKSSGMKIEYLAQDPDFDEESTILEQVFKGDTPVLRLIRDYENTLEEMTAGRLDEHIQKSFSELSDQMSANHAWDMESQIKTILTQLGIHDFTRKMKTLSGGQKKRVALAGALVTPCDLLILDEPTNHLDNKMIDWLEGHIRRMTGSLLMITHDRYFLDRVVTKIMEIDQGNLYVYEGNYTYHLEKKLERQELAGAIERKRLNLYRKELAWIQRGAKARSTKQQARIQRFDALKDAKVDISDSQLEISSIHSRLGQKIIELNNLQKSYGATRILNGFTYTFQKDDRIGVVGDNGVGKTTLLNILIGKAPLDAGTVELGDTVKLAYFSQRIEWMNESLRAIEYIKETAEYVTTSDGHQISASQLMETFLFPSDLQWTPINKLSGGEKRRLYLMKILMEAPNVLVLDEPTNDIDIDTLKVLEAYIDDFRGPVITVSHDRYFLDRICNKILHMDGKGNVTQYTGNYSDFARNNRNANTLLTESSEPLKDVKSKAALVEDKKARVKTPTKLSYNEKREFETIDEEIQKLEEKLDHISNEIIRYSTEYTKLEPLLAEKDQLEEQLLKKMERQEYLTSLVEEYEKLRS
ncbi:ABC-F family ATP-binding cassette domain-containing protein [Proteiniclasticum sp. QWL-01]|uniref:ABC-F family ATP-binding cassette domain-containing protein n=1 Tax=Proteiniclasticum sp. QWL-01 TaxID=3036945 RepID=UPI00241134BF|nr:ABC-F family ATP-binding cassette domain-containing protein [Proteiniclasticum sp. QWL-01]WFF73704.1 ABC-F family ATP-binding cassette domain-containing protein [Proteiniclasticum sp. QWL-01]